jgi:hypothetical protein
MEGLNKTKVIIDGFDAMAITKFIDKISNRRVAVILTQLEELVDDRELYLKLRKLILDALNDHNREIVRALFNEG